MSWKLDENGNIVVKDGNPVYLDTNGEEKTIAVDTIARLNREAKEHREAKEVAFEKLKKYEGIDPEKAKVALDKLSKIGDKELLDSGEIDKLKEQMERQYTQTIAEKEKALQEYTQRYNDMLIENVFSQSNFIRNNVAIPPEFFEARYRNNFKVVDGKVVAYGKDGEPLRSKERAYEIASPEEALKMLAENDPNKESILRANVASGSGSTGAGGGNGGSCYVKRSDFEKMDAGQQAEVVKKISAKQMVLTD